MTNVPLSFLPGVCKVNTSFASSSQSGGIDGRSAMGRFTDMDKMRFVASFPEKIGGWAKEYASALTGTPRGMKDWRDFSQDIFCGIGTSKKLYVYQAPALTDITPFRVIVDGTLSDKLTTSSGSSLVSVEHTDHGLHEGDYFQMIAADPVGGLTIGDVYFVETVTDVDNYIFDAGIPAGSTEVSGGGTIDYEYFRIELTDPFDTVSGSSTVTVNQTQHGAAVGDFVTIEDATAVGGLTLNGEYQVTTVSTNSYTIDAGTAASSTATGGGTPSLQYDISIGYDDSLLSYGYGTGGYSRLGYGEPSASGALLLARTWSLDKYGQQLLANPYGDTIYVWDPDIGGRAYPLYGAPEMCLGMFVTDERFPIALGINGNAMQIAWPDQSNYKDWVSTALNTANSGRTLQEGSNMIGGLAIRDTASLMFSNTAAYTLEYTGDNSVYASPVAGKKCGLIGPLAKTSLAGVGYWMGINDLWNWNGGVQPLPTDDIRDSIYKNINLVQAQKFVVGANAVKKEIWGFYCSADSDENDRYWIYHTDQQVFSLGSMERTSWLDKELFPYPMATDASGYLYDHEFGVDADGAAMDSYIEFSPMDIATADRIMDVFAFIPDFKRQIGQIELYPLAQDYPQSAQVIYGPELIEDDGTTPIIGLRIGTRLLGYKLRQNVIGGDWRLGMPYAEIQPAGARR